MFLSSDGELVILKEAFDAEVQAAFEDLGTDYMKHAPSRTDDYQANDKSSNFMNTKAGAKKARRDCVNTSNPILEKNLKEYVRALRLAFPNVKLSSALQKKIFEGVMCLVHVFKEKYFTPAKIVKGFVDSGEHVPDADPTRGEITVNYDYIMSKTDSKRTAQELHFMKECVPLVVAEMRANGRASNAFLDNLGIAKDTSAKNRDNSVIDKQDAVLITHEKTVLRYQEYEARKQLLQDPVHIHLEKRLENAKRLVLANQKKDSKKAKAAETKAAAEQKKIAEKERRKGLSKEEIRLETAAKKHEKALKAAHDAEALAKSLDEARDLLGPAAVALLLGQGGVASRLHSRYPDLESFPLSPFPPSAPTTLGALSASSSFHLVCM